VKPVPGKGENHRKAFGGSVAQVTIDLRSINTLNQTIGGILEPKERLTVRLRNKSSVLTHL
jgi:hypothetical protein